MAESRELPDDEVPAILHSVQNGRPFTACVDCGAGLLAGEAPYAVEKVIRQGEVVFEYAICAECTKNQMRSFSEESLGRVSQYLQAGPHSLDHQMLESFFLVQTRPGLRNGEILELTSPVDHCHRCGRVGTSFAEEHTLMGLLHGHRLQSGLMTLCSGCTEGADAVLSHKTREAHEDFVRTHFPGVPAGVDLPAGLFAF
jgi:hypothetical protein